jgi:hypothetical protein
MGIMFKDTDFPSYKSINVQLMLGNKTTQYILIYIQRNATKLAGSIPDGVIGIFHSHNSSGRAMALGLTQPLTEMSTRNISWE